MNFWEIGHHLRLGRWVHNTPTQHSSPKKYTYKLTANNVLKVNSTNPPGRFTHASTHFATNDLPSNTWELVSIEEQTKAEQSEEKRNQDKTTWTFGI